MNKRKIVLGMMLTYLAGMLVFSSIAAAAAAPGSGVWIGSGGNNGWGGFMQRIMQPDYRLQMSNGTPYWNTLMLPVNESAATTGMSSYMGMPAFGFCAAPGQCYMVLVQNPVSSGGSGNYCVPVPLPAQPAPNQQDKPTSLW